MRRLWVVRINAAVRPLGMSYSRLIGALKTKNVVINRKMLSELAIRDFNAFKAVVDSVK
jgi:large subunit ribosomal protein L20